MKQQIYLINYDIEKFLHVLTKNNIDISSILGKRKLAKSLILDNSWNSRELPSKYILLSSRAFLNQITLEELSTEELQSMLEALNYISIQEQNRNKKNKELASKIAANTEIWKLEPEHITVLLNKIIDYKKRNTNKIKYLNNKITEITILLEARKNHNKKIRIKKS